MITKEELDKYVHSGGYSGYSIDEDNLGGN